MMEEMQSVRPTAHKNKTSITADEEAIAYDRFDLEYQSDLNLIRLVPDIDPHANVESKTSAMRLDYERSR